MNIQLLCNTLDLIWVLGFSLVDRWISFQMDFIHCVSAWSASFSFHQLPSLYLLLQCSQFYCTYFRFSPNQIFIFVWSCCRTTTLLTICNNTAQVSAGWTCQEPQSVDRVDLSEGFRSHTMLEFEQKFCLINEPSQSAYQLDQHSIPSWLVWYSTVGGQACVLLTRR